MRILALIVTLFSALFIGLSAPAFAQSQSLEDLMMELPKGNFSDRAEVVQEIARTGDPRAAKILELLADGDLAVHDDLERVVEIRSEGRDDFAFDPFTGEELGEVGRRDATPIRVNNNLRREIDAARGLLQLRAENPVTRGAAARATLQAADPGQIEVIDQALADETNPSISATLRLARAAAVLNSDLDVEAKQEAINTLAKEGGTAQLGRLREAARSDNEDVAAAANAAIKRLERTAQMWDAAETVWYGLSLGSVLLLAAIGLAITFGVMGVINMAHGEMVMIGAYTTYVTQQLLRAWAPGMLEASVIVAIPAAFLVAGLVGVAIERGVIRFLYGRPLETLLATWGISLILQQTVRSLFGPTNRQVITPSWMSGSFDLGGMELTYNRVTIVFFSLAVFAVLLALLRYSFFGLRLRAVMQNRRMASSMGIRTPWIDAMTFGLGSGIAGIGGVALSQIDNVSPNLGQSYIIDSFMVVVFGGVGNLWGTLVGAMTLGVANKFLEPWAGAVLAKILVLIFIILFIQKRPRGLFAQKGRAVEA